MPRNFSTPEPAPGWEPGHCYCGCGMRLPRSDVRYFVDRTHRSTKAPDGRLVTEHRTKWCNECSQRLPIERFPLQTKRLKQGYVQRPAYYCQTCLKIHLDQISRDMPVELHRQRAHDYYHDPFNKPRILARNKARKLERMQDPEEWKRLKQQQQRQWKRYSPQRKRAMRQLRYQRSEEDRDPLVIPRGHLMVEWLYQQIDRYCEERDLSGTKAFGPLMGKNWSRFREGARSSGGKYMTMAMVDVVLVRLDLTYRLDDFPFKRRSHYRWGELDATCHEHDREHDQDDQKDHDERHGAIPPLGLTSKSPDVSPRR